MTAIDAGSGRLARVRSFEADRHRIYFEFRDGVIGYLAGSQPYLFEVGELLLVDLEEGMAEPAPEDLWQETNAVGVVLVKNEDQTILAVNGNLALVPTSEASYDVGNTVEVEVRSGEIVDVLMPGPVSMPRDDDRVSIEHFKVDLDDLDESFDDYGGMESVIERAKELIELTLQKRHLVEETRARPVKGVLMAGPPGTGKTMLARIIAKKSGASFYAINGPQIFSKWLGDSEAIVRRVFEDAADNAPSIIFFDEIDSVASRREESHEGSRRVVAQLLASMDGFERNDNVVVVAATNRIEDVDEALRRPGRFDWEIEFPPYPNEDDRVQVLNASANKLNVVAGLPVEEVAGLAHGWTPAQLAAIWKEAAMLAVADDRGQIRTEDLWGGFERVKASRVLQQRVDTDQAPGEGVG